MSKVCRQRGFGVYGGSGKHSCNLPSVNESNHCPGRTCPDMHPKCPPLHAVERNNNECVLAIADGNNNKECKACKDLITIIGRLGVEVTVVHGNGKCTVYIGYNA